ncbi:MAG: glycosyltransferase [Peptococcaceae bacterium]|nr:glycosyltransferase [Peptococcaceae bacterium]
MNEDFSGKVYYLCFYFDPEMEDKVVTYPSVISKIDYVVDTLKGLNKEVTLVSIAPSKSGYFAGYRKKIDDLENHVYLRSRYSKNKFVRKAFFISHSITILSYLLKNVMPGDIVLVYHSLYNRLWLGIYRLFLSNMLVLQIEDVFSELSERTKRFKKYEWNLLRKMRKCICVNDIVYAHLPDVPQKIISYGSYKTIPQYHIPHNKPIRLVYAGVIEQERQAAFLAVKSMCYLNEGYELNILGFGDEENIAALEKLIKEVNKELGRNAVVYHGRFSGEEYWKFLQGCDIALSTHAYTSESFSSADYTFPSKVLTYMANGLRVVAQRLTVLEKSSIAEYLHFYDNPDPKLIADTITEIDLNLKYDSRAVVSKLDELFAGELEKMLTDVTV